MVEIIAESPLAKAVQEAVRPKLVELGWSSGLQDDTLAEYIILMLSTGKSQSEIASELSNDLLDLGPDDQDAVGFAQWLFEQIDTINAKLNGTSTNGNAPATVQEGETNYDEGAQIEADDTEMGDASTATGGNIPTGPKAMRNGGAKAGRSGRMLGQTNKNFHQQSDTSLHRVRGSGRVNSHSREPPKGPRSQNLQRGLQMTAHRAPGNMQVANPAIPMPMQPMPSMPTMQQPGVITAQDQLQLMNTLAEAAQAMAFQMQHLGANNMFSQGVQNGGFGAGARPNRSQGFQDRRHQNGNRFSSNTQDSSMGGGTQTTHTEQGDPEAGGQGGRPLNKIPCKFDLNCTKADCPFAHHSPEAKQGDVLPQFDMENECTYGARCANKHCNGRHPSRAKRANFQAEKDCLYGPWCANPHCHFKHPPPGTRECRNGGDCKVEGCTFWHTKIECKHNPCKNALCKYKHKEGQRAFNFGHVWTAGEEKKNIGESKLVEGEAAQEGLTLSGKMDDSLPESHNVDSMEN